MPAIIDVTMFLSKIKFKLCRIQVDQLKFLRGTKFEFELN
jgi:hypothetical protein